MTKNLTLSYSLHIRTRWRAPAQTDQTSQNDKGSDSGELIRSLLVPTMLVPGIDEHVGTIPLTTLYNFFSSPDLTSTDT